MDWQWLSSQGIAVIVLGLILYGLWKTSIWLRDNVVTPVVKAHLELIEVLKEHAPKQTEALTSIKSELEDQTNTMVQQNVKLEKALAVTSKAVESAAEATEHVAKVIKTKNGN